MRLYRPFDWDTHVGYGGDLGSLHQFYMEIYIMYKDMLYESFNRASTGEPDSIDDSKIPF